MKKLKESEVDALQSAASEIVSVLDAIDELREATEAEIGRLLTELIEPQETARGILEDAASAADEYYDERSEKWQEGDAGQAYDEWRNRLRSLADDLGEEIDPPTISEVERPTWVDDLGSVDFAEFEA